MSAWRNAEVIDRDGDPIGTLHAVFLDRKSGQPEWGLVNTGLFGLPWSWVPLTNATGDRGTEATGIALPGPARSTACCCG